MTSYLVQRTAFEGRRRIDVAPGELVAFLGPNGAGKSTRSGHRLGRAGGRSLTCVVGLAVDVRQVQRSTM